MSEIWKLADGAPPHAALGLAGKSQVLFALYHLQIRIYPDKV